MEENATFEKIKTILKKAIIKLLYLNQTRPDIAFRLSFLSRVSPDMDMKDKVKEARERINEVRKE